MADKSRLGYSKGSPYRDNPYIDIKSPQGLIDMSNTDMDLYAIDNTGLEKYLPAYSGMHQFDGDVIREIPMKKGGPSPSKAREMLKDGKVHGKKLTARQKRYFGWIYGKSKKQQGGLTSELVSFLMNDEDEGMLEAEKLEQMQEEQEAMDIAVAKDEAVYEARLAQDEALALGLANEVYDLDMNEADLPPIDEDIYSSTTPYTGEILSSGKHGAENIGEYGRQIYSELTNDLGYAPTVNSIFRDPAQNTAVGGVKNSWHLTGNAIDLTPADWEKLGATKQAYYKQNYDHVYHNNHHHLEPKGTPVEAAPAKSTSVDAKYDVAPKGKINPRTQQAMNFFVGKGLPHHVAAGIVGNLMQESGNFKTSVIEGTEMGDKGRSFGIAQWQKDRRPAMIAWAKKKGMNPYTLEAQLEYVYHEAEQRGDLDYIRNSKNSGEAAYKFAEKYERPQIIDSNRIGFARRLAPY